jgi:glycosidase
VREGASLARRAVAAVLLAVIGAGGCQPVTSSTPPGASSDAGASGPPASLGSSGIGAAPACVTAAAPPLEPWRDRTFYEVFVRSFSDSDGDGIGDLAGLTAKLDTLNDGDPTTSTDLGITGIWLMPVAEAASYHGYDVIDYTAVEEDYGDLGTMRSFVQAAHERGILVIVDFVINHTSSRNPWFVDALAGGEHRDWYIWSDTDPGWPAVAGPNPWHRTSDGDFYYGAFSDEMPDLNLRNPDVTAALTGIATTWLDDIGVDGFRIDAAKHLIETGANDQVNTPETKAWLADFRAVIHQAHPDALVLGEVWDARGVSASYTRDGALDMSFDFLVGPAIASGAQGDVTTATASLEEVATRYAPGAAATFLSNHDQPRIATQLNGDADALARAAALLLTGPGVPFIYYGEELGMTGTKPDPDIRAPYPWDGTAPGFGFTTGTPWEPFSEGAATANRAAEADDLTSIWSTYRDLVQLRDATPALRAGDFVRVKTSNISVAAWLRDVADQHVLVLHNLGDEPAADVSLDLREGPLCGTPTPLYLYAASPEELDEATLPTITPSGGLDGYVPLPNLPAGATVVFELSQVVGGA